MATRSLTCPQCKQTVTTSAAPGQTTRCKKCKSEVRVPLREVEHARRELTCDACGATQLTSTPPGKRTTCQGCGAQVRVPLRDPRAAPAPAADEHPGRRRVEAGRTCPYCRSRTAPGAVVCPSCKGDLGLLPESLPGGRLGGATLLLLGLGGIAALAARGSTLLRGYALFAVLAVVGGAALFAGRRGPRRSSMD